MLIKILKIESETVALLAAPSVISVKNYFEVTLHVHGVTVKG